MNVDLEAAVHYPFRDEDWVKTVAIGGGLALLPGVLGVFAFVVSLIPVIGLLGVFLYPVVFVVTIAAGIPLLGYNVAVLRGTLRGEDRPPRFDDWRRLFRDGLYGTALAIAHFLPLVAVFLVVGVVAVAAMVGLTGATDAEGLVGGLFVLAYFGSLAVTMLYSLAVAYAFPISLATYAETGDLRAALSLEQYKRVGLDKRYAVVWLVAYLGMQVANLVLGFLIFFLVGFFLQFVLTMVYFRLIGQGYADAAGGRDPSGDAGAGEGRDVGPAGGVPGA